MSTNWPFHTKGIPTVPSIILYVTGKFPLRQSLILYCMISQSWSVAHTGYYVIAGCILHNLESILQIMLMQFGWFHLGSFISFSFSLQFLCSGHFPGCSLNPGYPGKSGTHGMYDTYHIDHSDWYAALLHNQYGSCQYNMYIWTIIKQYIGIALLKYVKITTGSSKQDRRRPQYMYTYIT